MRRLLALAAVSIAIGAAAVWIGRSPEKPPERFPNQSLGLSGSGSAMPFGPAPDLAPGALTVSMRVPLPERLDDLHRRAREGNAEAALAAYKIEANCYFLRHHSDEPVLKDRFADGIKACASLSPRAVDDMYSDVHQAAQAGVKGAAFDFVAAGFPGDEVPHAPDSKDPVFVQWRDDALSFLSRDAKAGSHEALVELVGVYSDGKLVTPDSTTAAVYAEAILEVVRSGAGFDFSSTPMTDFTKGTPNYSDTAAAIEKELPADDVKAIREKARAIALECCMKP